MATRDQANNSEKFNKNMQGADKASKGIKQTVAELTNEITRLNEDLKSMSNNFKQIAKNTKDIDTKELIDSTAKSIDRIKKLNEVAEENFLQFKKTGKMSAKMEKDRDSAQIEYNRLLSKEEILRERLDSAIEGSPEQKSIEETLGKLQDKRIELTKNLKVYGEIEEAAEKIKEATGFLDGMEKYVEHIPFVGKFLTSASKRSAELRKNLADGADESAIMAANMSAIAETAGKVAMAGFFTAVTKGFGTMDERTKSFTSQFNISKDASKVLNRNIVEFAARIPGQTAAKLAEAMVSVSTNLGAVVKLSNESARAFSVMTNNLGLSSEQANKLLMTSVSQDKNIEDFNQNLAGSVTLLNASSGVAVRFQDVMADIASASAGTQLNTAKFPGGLEKAAYQARRFGMTLSGLENSASNLLNFEESIGAELEAELLTGKSLNLERARAAALTGNQTVLAEELKKNIGDIDQFQNQSVLAQEAQARALGMTRDEVAEILMRQKALTALAKVEGNSLEAKVKTRLKEINAIKDVDERERALAKLKQDTGAEQLIQQEQSRTLQQRMLEATEKIADAAGVMVAPFTAVGAIFDSIGKASAEMMGFMGKIGSKALILAAHFKEKIAPPVEKVSKFFSGISDKLGKIGEKIKNLMPAAFKGAGKGAVRSFLKKIPILGLAVGAYLGFQRAKKGDYLGMLAEVGSGIASLFPGVGTAVSAGIDVALAGSDMAGVTGRDRKDQGSTVTAINQGLKTGGMMTAALGPMGGGIMFNKMILKKLGDLIGVTKSSGDQIANAANKDIYMGPEKVGTSLSVSSIKNDG